MGQLLRIPVSGDDAITCKVVLPDSAPKAYILNCGGKRWIYTITGIEKNLVKQGFALAYVSPRSYSGKADLSIDKFVNDLALVAEKLKREYGTALFAMGHSLGAYVIARLVLTSECPPLEAIALLSPPLSLGKAVNGLPVRYDKLPRIMRKIAAKTVLFVTHIRHDGSAAALLDEILAEPSLDDMVSGDNSNGNSAISTPTRVVYGERDPYLFKDAGSMLELQQQHKEYEAMWQRIAPNSMIEGCQGLGHYFSTGVWQNVRQTLLRRTSPEANAIACEIGSYFKNALVRAGAVN